MGYHAELTHSIPTLQGSRYQVVAEIGKELGFVHVGVAEDWTLYWADTRVEALKVPLNRFQVRPHEFGEGGALRGPDPSVVC